MHTLDSNEDKINVSVLSLTKIVKLVNLFALLWLVGGGQLFLFVSRMHGFWFDGFYGYLSGVIVGLAILSTVLIDRPFVIKRDFLFFYSLLITCICLSLLCSTKIQGGDLYALRKFISLIPYVFIPSFWGMLFANKIRVGEEWFISCCIVLLIWGNIYIYSLYSSSGFTGSYIRIGYVEANTIQLSYAFANIWIIILSKIFRRENEVLFAIFSSIAILNVFIFATRQSLVYLILIVTYLVVRLVSPFRFMEEFTVWVSKRKAKLLIIVLICTVSIGIFLWKLALSLDSKIIEAAMNAAKIRWLSFFEKGYTDPGRELLFKEGIDIWGNNLFFGEFAYEDIGRYPHHMIADFLAQYGAIGGIIYFIIIVLALFRAIRSPKETLFLLIFYVMFLGLLFVGITVTQVTTNPIFHFLLFFWLSQSQRNYRQRMLQK